MGRVFPDAEFCCRICVLFDLIGGGGEGDYCALGGGRHGEELADLATEVAREAEAGVGEGEDYGAG